MAWFVETNVRGVVMTSRPSTSAAIIAKCSAAVPLFKAMACLTPRYSANFFSNSAVFGPRPTHPEAITFRTASNSSSP